MISKRTNSAYTFTPFSINQQAVRCAVESTANHSSTFGVFIFAIQQRSYIGYLKYIVHNFKEVVLVILIRFKNYNYYYKTEYYDNYQGCEIGMMKTRSVP